MTQAINLANLANNVDASGNLSPSALSGSVPVAKGGTGGTTQATAQSGLDVPSRSGANATGIWGISITGNAATATSATSASSTPLLASGNWRVEVVADELVFKYNNTIVAKIGTDGSVVSAV